jgi:FkbM family methyltransferase
MGDAYTGCPVWRDAAYLGQHYTLKHRVIAAISRRLDGYVYTIRRGLAAGMRCKGGLGFLPIGHDTAETRFFASLDLAGLVVYDIGAFRGLLTMFFASKARSVVAFEPNPVSTRRLVENVALNALSNVQVMRCALGAADGEADLVFDDRMAGGASADPSVGGQILRAGGRHLGSTRIAVRTVDAVVAETGAPPDFVKIDVEGMELAVLQGADKVLRTHRPALYIELHGATPVEKQANAERVVALLHDVGYREIVHVETGARMTPNAATPTGHLYCAGRRPKPRPRQEGHTGPESDVPFVAAG